MLESQELKHLIEHRLEKRVHARSIHRAPTAQPHACALSSAKCSFGQDLTINPASTLASSYVYERQTSGSIKVGHAYMLLVASCSLRGSTGLWAEAVRTVEEAPLELLAKGFFQLLYVDRPRIEHALREDQGTKKV